MSLRSRLQRLERGQPGGVVSMWDVIAGAVEMPDPERIDSRHIELRDDWLALAVGKRPRCGFVELDPNEPLSEGE